ncbi:MAG: M24 family metallopeptidase [Pseudobacteriovorax sp.]|nr:M24 family metallopeptidase [Pseudobacteriovorax sp.]
MQAMNELRQAISQTPYDAVLIPGTDPHQSEYPPTQWETRQYYTGFTGSNGHLIVSKDRALLTTDSRYELQVAKEVDFPGIETQIIPRGGSFTSEINWAVENIPNLSKLAVDPRLISLDKFQELTDLAESHGFELELIDDALIDQTWANRPNRPMGKVRLSDESFHSSTRSEKISMVQSYLKDVDCDLHVMTDLESIARTLNITGEDAGVDLVALSYLVIGDEICRWFIDGEKIADAAQELPETIEVLPYDSFSQSLKELSQGKRILLDRRDTTVFVLNSIHDSANIQFGRSPGLDLKQIKSPEEIEHMVNAHINDAVALAEGFTKLIAKVERQETISEYEAGELISAEREKRPQFLTLSFNPIVGYQSNGAIVHYRAEEETCSQLKAEGIVLIDSGGHYENGTTDITRTLALGPVTDDMIQRYTQVLKGHIGINRLKFAKNVAPSNIELIARMHLLSEGLNYGHGTGHGVGYGTAVHESAEASLTMANRTPFQPGWVISNEPGFYLEGEFGIRIENLIAVEEISDEFYGFRQLSHFPYERDLIDLRELSNSEITWINQYHESVANALISQLSQDAGQWIAEKCAPLPLHD